MAIGRHRIRQTTSREASEYKTSVSRQTDRDSRKRGRRRRGRRRKRTEEKKDEERKMNEI